MLFALSPFNQLGYGEALAALLAALVFGDLIDTQHISSPRHANSPPVSLSKSP
jgi:hypothetical protein